MLTISILKLDGDVINISAERKDKGEVVFDKVCESVDLVEKDYFGLKYEDKTGVVNWLDLNKRLGRTLKSEHWEFQFAVKFYPPDPSQLQEDVTRYQLCLQVRNDILTGKLLCSFVTYAMLGSYLVQSELGDYTPEEYPDSSYLKSFRFSPEQSPQLEQKVMELHKTHKGQTPAEAELHYLENAKKLAMYGVDFHPAKDSEGVDITLGVCSTGLLVYRERLRINRFAWPKILKISYKRNHFYVKIRPGDYEPYESTIVFKLESHRAAKRLWNVCVEHHTFFRLMTPEDVARPGLIPGISNKFPSLRKTHYQTKKNAIEREPPASFRKSQRYPTSKSLDPLVEMPSNREKEANKRHTMPPENTQTPKKDKRIPGGVPVLPMAGGDMKRKEQQKENGVNESDDEKENRNEDDKKSKKSPGLNIFKKKEGKKDKMEEMGFKMEYEYEYEDDNSKKSPRTGFSYEKRPQDSGSPVSGPETPSSPSKARTYAFNYSPDPETDKKSSFSSIFKKKNKETPINEEKTKIGLSSFLKNKKDTDNEDKLSLSQDKNLSLKSKEDQDKNSKEDKDKKDKDKKSKESPSKTDQETDKSTLSLSKSLFSKDKKDKKNKKSKDSPSKSDPETEKSPIFKGKSLFSKDKKDKDTSIDDKSKSSKDKKDKDTSIEDKSKSSKDKKDKDASIEDKSKSKKDKKDKDASIEDKSKSSKDKNASIEDKSKSKKDKDTSIEDKSSKDTSIEDKKSSKDASIDDKIKLSPSKEGKDVDSPKTKDKMSSLFSKNKDKNSGKKGFFGLGGKDKNEAFISSESTNIDEDKSLKNEDKKSPKVKDVDKKSSKDEDKKSVKSSDKKSSEDKKILEDKKSSEDNKSPKSDDKKITKDEKSPKTGIFGGWGRKKDEIVENDDTKPKVVKTTTKSSLVKDGGNVTTNIEEKIEDLATGDVTLNTAESMMEDQGASPYVTATAVTTRTAMTTEDIGKNEKTSQVEEKTVARTTTTSGSRQEQRVVTQEVRATTVVSEPQERRSSMSSTSSDDSGTPIDGDAIHHGYQEPIVETEAVFLTSGQTEAPQTTTSAPLVTTSAGLILPSVISGDTLVSGEIVSSQTITSKTRTVETVTYKTEKDGVVETRVEQKITIQSDGDPIDHDKALAEAIQEATAMNPDMQVEKIEIQQESLPK